ncbi:PREDICTED: protein ADP-ribosylarginine hydrolase-like [Amphimedon queenslandica]|uniref:ADP-ribosylhydrolase ARH1 n=1 Tax=Amphimedon queenslandica TaxID=400682 RepID=A0A1X7VA37_AMPQE|nr:PREDICTED: protein ADP-ribosylarginine hydrolase-like [Amphimedon queenslandica]|eukprot:XP_003385106.3 PREDICTED: protein ADP-ribosylarginine hydrolase-like [Amphimedon queenslandica]
MEDSTEKEQPKEEGTLTDDDKKLLDKTTENTSEESKEAPTPASSETNPETSSDGATAKTKSNDGTTEEGQQSPLPVADDGDPKSKETLSSDQGQPPIDSKIKFKACMLLAGVGDALGYKNGAYEFCRNGPAINREVDEELGGVKNIKVNTKNWMVSDDTVMHIATAEALVSKWADDEALYTTLATKYIKCMKDMSGRAPGNTCRAATSMLRPHIRKGYVIPFNSRGGGCGAAMRAVPIGLLYNRPDQLNDLVAISIESGRMTHNHPTGYLGALAVALFVSYAYQGKPLKEWGVGLLQTLEVAWKYIEDSGNDVKDNQDHWSYFKESWEKYVDIRGIRDGKSDPVFPTPFGPQERDRFYSSISFSGWGGSSGHDAPMIAYDALLGCGNSWKELCSRAMFHGGDSDSTGIIAAACWGAMRGFEDVPECNYKNLEYRDRLEKLSKQLLEKYTSKD